MSQLVLRVGDLIASVANQEQTTRKTKYSLPGRRGYVRTLSGRTMEYINEQYTELWVVTISRLITKSR